VLALWSGLGYYGRARNLHAAARAILLRHGGEVPGDVTALRALPGIGRYTAGAIASIAFGARVPVVDGNVTRILTRVFDIDIGVWTAPARRRLWAIAEKLADDPDPGAVNQGLMELGARVCAPRDPACPVCPLRAQCLARRRGTIPSRPVVKAKKAVPVIRLLAAVVRRADGSVLLVRGPEDGLFGGLWGVPLHPATGRTAAAKRLALRLALAKDGLGAAVVGERAATIAHVLSHRRLVVDVFTARWQGRAPRIARGRPCRFVRTRAELDGLGVSALTRKVLAAAGPS
jgi:A/G-specific adenine glycosylase